VVAAVVLVEQLFLFARPGDSRGCLTAGEDAAAAAGAAAGLVALERIEHALAW